MLPVMESMWLLESSALSCLAAAAEFDKASSGGERMEEERVEWRGADDSGPGVEWRLGAGAGAGERGGMRPLTISIPSTGDNG